MIKNAISTPNLPEIKEIKVDKNKLEDIKKAVITPPLEEITVMLSVDIDFADGTSGSGFFNVIVKKQINKNIIIKPQIKPKGDLLLLDLDQL